MAKLSELPLLFISVKIAFPFGLAALTFGISAIMRARRPHVVAISGDLKHTMTSLFGKFVTMGLIKLTNNLACTLFLPGFSIMPYFKTKQPSKQ